MRKRERAESEEPVPIEEPLSEHEELNTKLVMAEAYMKSKPGNEGLEEPESLPEPQGKLTQWTSPDGKHFVGSSKSVGKLPPGLYDLSVSPQTGLIFEYLGISTEGLLRFPDTPCERILREIQTFWDKKEVFKEYSLTHKRGILLWGPPGSGKTCTIRLVIQDVVERGGIAIRFGQVQLFMIAMRILRDIQPETPVVVLMEDLDTIIRGGESAVLNVLDGAEAVEHTVFLASTNYPELLGPRIVNRPSRFDKRFKIGHPSLKSRLVYLEYLVGRDRAKSLKLDLRKWSQETEGFSLAHLKELFVAVVILGDEYDEALKTLKTMKDTNLSSDREGRRAGLVEGRAIPPIGSIDALIGAFGVGPSGGPETAG